MTTTNPTIDDPTVKLAGVILAVHLVANGLHGFAHTELGVTVGPVLTAIILLASFGLPVVAVFFLWRGWAATGWALVAVAMAVSFGFGVYLHFLVSNPDHVTAIPVGSWQLPFQVTAVALAVTDAVGAVLGGWLWWTARGRRRPEPPRSGRLDGVPDSGFRPLTRLTYWFSRRQVGEVVEPLTIAAHHPRILAAVSGYELALGGADRVDDRLTELAVLKAAMVIGCEFCLDIGTAVSRDLGVSDEQLRALSEFEDADAFTDVERLVLKYAAAMSRTPTDVPDELYEALAAVFDEDELVELTAAIAWENYRGRFNQAFRLDAQGFGTGEFCPRPERPPTTHELHPDVRG